MENKVIITENKIAADISETKKLLDTLGECSAKMYNLDWKKIAAECADLDGAEKKELIGLSAKKILAGLLAIIST